MTAKELTHKSYDILRALESQLGETVALGILLPEAAKGQVLAEVKGTSGVAIHVEVDYRFHLHTSAPGKAMLAHLPKKERNEIISRIIFKRFTPSTITNPKDFQAELDAVISRGYSTDISEQFEGMYCIGVPVFDETKKVVAAIWTTGVAAQLPLRIFPDVAKTLKKGAAELSQRLRSTGRNPDRTYVLLVVDAAVKIINSTLNGPIDMKELAETLYVSYSWFRKVFKEQTGEAPAEYHLNRRLEKARELLASSGMSVREISESLGFKNQNHFSALFKRKTGRSPTEFRPR
jgi:DNA-binding IclR family transcriptional regulator